MKRHTTDTKKRRQWTHRAARKRTRTVTVNVTPTLSAAVGADAQWLGRLQRGPGWVMVPLFTVQEEEVAASLEAQAEDLPPASNETYTVTSALKESDRAYLAAGDFTKECAARKRLRDAGLIAYNVKAHTWTRT